MDITISTVVGIIAIDFNLNYSNLHKIANDYISKSAEIFYSPVIIDHHDQ